MRRVFFLGKWLNYKGCVQKPRSGFERSSIFGWHYCITRVPADVASVSRNWKTFAEVSDYGLGRCVMPNCVTYGCFSLKSRQSGWKARPFRCDRGCQLYSHRRPLWNSAIESRTIPELRGLEFRVRRFLLIRIFQAIGPCFASGSFTAIFPSLLSSESARILIYSVCYMKMRLQSSTPQSPSLQGRRAEDSYQCLPFQRVSRFSMVDILLDNESNSFRPLVCSCTVQFISNLSQTALNFNIVHLIKSN